MQDDFYGNLYADEVLEETLSLLSEKYDWVIHKTERANIPSIRKIGLRPNLSLIHISEPTRPY